MYDYREHITDDIREYIRDNVDLNEWKGRRDDLEEELRDDLWTADSVTGNASGSYYFNAWKAEEALCHNWDLLADALEEFGSDTDILRRGPEACDVIIRCYLLDECLSEVLDELEEAGELGEPEDLEDGGEVAPLF